MANYSIPRARDAVSGGGDVTVTEATVNQTTAVSLVGQNFTGYGDEIATNFLQMLENFASATPPESNTRVNGGTTASLTGQLWYDTGNAVLKVYDGTGWQSQAKANEGAYENSSIRWNDTNKRWQPEERVRITEAGSLQIAFDQSTTNQVNFNHGGTHLVTTFSGTTDWQISGLGGDLTLLGGSGFSVENGGSAIALNVNGSNQAVWSVFSVNSVEYPSGLKINTGASNTTRAGLAIPHGTAPSAPVNGDIWTTTAGVFARVNGSTIQLNDVAGGTIGGTIANDQVAVGDGADAIDGSASLTWNGTTLAVIGGITATTFGGIASANLLDKSTDEQIAGQWTFTNAVNPVIANAGDLQATNDNGFKSTATGGSYSFAVRALASGSVQFTNSGTPDWIISGVGTMTTDCPIWPTSQGAEAIRIRGDATAWNTCDSYISFYDSDESEYGLQIGTTAGTATTVINSRIGFLDLYAQNTRIFAGTSFATTLYANGVNAGIFQEASTANHSSSLLIYDRNDESHPAGFNGSPEADDAADDIDTTNRTMGLQYVGKMVSRSTASSRTFTLSSASSIPVGATVLLHNDNSSGTFTVNQVTNTTLQWVDGSGSAPVTGTRTIAYNSVATLRKKSQSGSLAVWQIWGNGLS